MSKALEMLVRRLDEAEAKQGRRKAEYDGFGCPGVHPQFRLQLGKREWKALRLAVKELGAKP